MKRNRSGSRTKCLILLILPITFGGCFNFGGFCWSQNYTPPNYDLYVFEGSSQLDELNLTNSYDFGEFYDEEPPIAMKLEGKGRFSADGTALIIGNKEGTTMIQYGPELAGDTQYVGAGELLINEDLKDMDLYPTENMLVSIENEVGSLKNTFTGEQLDDVLIRSGIQGTELNSHTTVLNYVQDAEFYDSTSYILNEFYAPRFNSRGEVLYIEKESHITIDGTTEDQQVISEQYWLFQTNETEYPDTLFALPSLLTTDSADDLDLRVGENAVLISSGQLLALFSFDGDLMYQTQTNGDFTLSNDGLSLSFNNGKQYYRVSDEKLINLSNINSRIIHAQPYEDYILLIDNIQRLSIIDLEQEKQTAIYSKVDLPIGNEPTGKATNQKLHFPVMTSEGNVKVLLGDKYIIDDPNDACDVS